MKKRFQKRVHFLTFYTEGCEKDLGSDLRQEAKDFMASAEPHFLSVTASTPSLLVSRGGFWPSVFEDQRDWLRLKIEQSEKKFSFSEAWAALGFFRWKSLFILDFLRNSPVVSDGDIVLYHDCNIRKYPEYLYGIHRWASFISSRLSESSVLLFDDSNIPLASDCKQEVLQRFGCEHLSNVGHVWSGALAVKKNAFGINFISDWASITSDIDNVSPVTEYGNAPGYVWHSVDQACLGVMYCMNIKNPKVKKIFLGGTRRIPPGFGVMARLSLKALLTRR